MLLTPVPCMRRETPHPRGGQPLAGVKKRDGEEHSVFAALQMHLTEGISNLSLVSSWNWGFGVSLFGFTSGFFPHCIFKPRYFHVSCPGGCFRKSNQWLKFLNSSWKSKKPGEPPSSLCPSCWHCC